MEEPIELQISSTSLGYKGEGGTIGVATSFLEGSISKEAYTADVLKNAMRAEEMTKEHFPEAKFGVSVLASAVDPKKLQESNINVGSVDYPYLVKFNSDFLKTKTEEVERQGKKGFGKLVSIAQEYGYAVLQSHTSEKQIQDTVSVSDLVQGQPRIRTCLETVLDEDSMNNIRKVNSLLKDKSSVIWAIEPNKKVGDGTLQEYLNRFIQMKNDYKNKDLSFGIDLDMGGLPNEERSLFELLDLLDKDNLLPLFISLSGTENINGGFRTHLPLETNENFRSKLGEWIKARRNRGQDIPSLIIETSPVQQNVLKDYEKFLIYLKSEI